MSKTEITKSALAASLRAVMGEKNFSQITIKDITSRCNVSRNAFYYHFHDKYDLVNWIFCSDVLPVIDCFTTPESCWNSFVDLCKYLMKNRTFYLEVFSYNGQNSLINSIENIYFELLKICISGIYQKIGCRLTDDHMNILARMWAHAYTGTICDWVNGGMRPEYIERFEKLNHLKPLFPMMFLGSDRVQDHEIGQKDFRKVPEEDEPAFMKLKHQLFDHFQEERVIAYDLEDVPRPHPPVNALDGVSQDICGMQSRLSTNPAAVYIDYETPAPVRGINMLLAKYRGEKYQSEVQITVPTFNPAPRLKKKLLESKIAFVTDGGLVPKGNPDNLVPINADKFCIYSFGGKNSLSPNDYEISHQGYENQYVLEDPNRLIPLDAARMAEFAGQIRKISDIFFSTTGVMVSVENSKKMGRDIAVCVVENEIDGVFLTSTCGTSTRCGAYIACSIEQLGIPVVHVTNLVQISEGVGCSRILQGSNVSYLFGDPRLPPKRERIYRLALFEKGLELMLAEPKENSCLIASLEP